jgi:hypothetical protein
VVEVALVDTLQDKQEVVEVQGQLLLGHQDQFLFQQRQEQIQLQHYRHQLGVVK